MLPILTPYNSGGSIGYRMQGYAGSIVAWPLVVVGYSLFFVARAFWRLFKAADLANRLNK